MANDNDKLQPHVYKTGDPHPIHNMLAFVEYGDSGQEVWTTIASDSAAPYRLASLSAQHQTISNGVSPDTCRSANHCQA